MTSPLLGKVVCVTRSDADAPQLTARLTALGASVVLAPSVRMRPITPLTAAMGQALDDLPRTAWVAFASRYAAQFFGALLQEHQVALPKSTRLAAVGQATAAVLAECLKPVALTAAVQTGEGLAAALVQHGRPHEGAVLLPAASAGRTIVRDTLRAHHFDVRHVPIYDTVEAGPADGPFALPPRVDYILFTSPSTVRGFLARSAAPPGAEMITMGPSTSAAARAHGLKVTREARAHSLDGLVDALLERISA